MSEEFEDGTLVKCRAVFTDPDTLAIVDPASVAALITSPTGTVTAYTYGADVELVRESAGHYRVNVSASELGTWTYRFTSSGTYQGAEEKRFYIY